MITVVGNLVILSEGELHQISQHSQNNINQHTHFTENVTRSMYPSHEQSSD